MSSAEKRLADTANEVLGVESINNCSRFFFRRVEAENASSADLVEFELSEYQRVAPRAPDENREHEILELREPSDSGPGRDHAGRDPAGPGRDHDHMMSVSQFRLVWDRRRDTVEPAGGRGGSCPIRDWAKTAQLRPLSVSWPRPPLEAEGRLVTLKGADDGRAPTKAARFEFMRGSDMTCSYLWFGKDFFPGVLRQIAVEITGSPNVRVKARRGDGWGEEGTPADLDYELMLSKRLRCGISQTAAKQIYRLLALPVGQRPYDDFAQRYVWMDQSGYGIKFRGSRYTAWSVMGAGGGREDVPVPAFDRDHWTFAMMAHPWEPELVVEQLLAALPSGFLSELLKIVAAHAVDDRRWAHAWRSKLASLHANSQAPAQVAKDGYTSNCVHI